MKKLILSLLFAISAGLNAYSIKDLEVAIKQSDTNVVEKILQEIEIPPKDQKRLLMLVDDIMQLRKSKYKSHFLNNMSISVISELSKKQKITLLAGFGLLLTSMVLNLKTLMSSCYTPASFNLSFWWTTVVINNFGSCLTGLPGGGIMFSVLFKHFMDIKKLYDNSIDIKQLVYEAINTTDN